MPAKPETLPQDAVSLAFAEAIAAGDYELAHTMLSARLQEATSAAQLADDFNLMTSYADCPPAIRPELLVMEGMNDWPDKQEGDVGWAYVAMFNNYYSEAVSVVVSHEQGRNVIREIVWGRP